MIRFRKAEDSDFIDWNAYVASMSNGNFRQTTYWAEIKELMGWFPEYYLVERDKTICGIVQIQYRKLPFIPFTLLYSCRGPVVDWEDEEAVNVLLSGLKEVVKKMNGILLRVDPEPVGNKLLIDKSLQRNGGRKIPDRCSKWNRTLYTTKVILNKSEDELFMQMRRTHRQNVKKAIKKGVTTKIETKANDHELFAALMKGLEYRKHSLVHSDKYHFKVFNNLVKSGIGYFIKAEYQGKVISGLIVVILEDKAWAVFIANDYEYRDLMPNKLLLWEAIRFAKEKGCRFLSLGASQATATFEPKSDPMDRLKNAYRPDVIYFPGYYDFVNRRLYPIFRYLENKVLPFYLKYNVKINKLIDRIKK